MIKNLNRQIIIELLETGQLQRLRSYLHNSHPGDIAAIINDLPDEEQYKLFTILTVETAASVMPELHQEVQEDFLAKINPAKLAGIITEMDSDDATDIISEIDSKQEQHSILERLDFEDKQSIEKLLSYDENTAGGIMQSEVASVPKEFTKAKVIQYIKENYEEIDNLAYIFVVGKDNHLEGRLDTYALFVMDDDQTIEQTMQTDLISTTTDTDQEKVAHLFRKYDLYAIPVVDKQNRLLGRITVDDVIDVIDDEASEDVYKMMGLENEDKVFSSPFGSFRKRVPWLLLNLLTAILVSSVVSIFEGVIQQWVFLAVLMPIVAGLGGNSGAQTLTVIIRGIAMGELTVNNSIKALRKEIIVGIFNGVAIGSVATGLAWLYKSDLMLGIVLGGGLICNMLIAGIVGALVPLMLRKFKLDPALGSNIIVTMLTDMGGFASFLSLAAILLH